MTKNMYTVSGDGPCNEELALRMQAGDKNAAERLVAQNEGYRTDLARAYTPWCEMEDLKQEAALALLDAAGRFDPAYGIKLLTYATPAIEAALSDYASRYAFPLSVPTSRGSQLRTVAHLCAEGWDSSDAELVKVVCGELNVSAKVAGALIKEYHKLNGVLPTAQTTEAFQTALSHGQVTEKEKALWEFVLSAYGDAEFSTKQLEKDFGNAAYATIRSFVLKFEKLGLLKSTQYGNRVKYAVCVC